MPAVLPNPRVALWGSGDLANHGDRQLAAVTRQELAWRLPGATFREFSPWSQTSSPEPLWVDQDGGWPGAGCFDVVVVVGGGVFAGPPFRHPVMQCFCLGPRPLCFDPSAAVAWNGVDVQDGARPGQDERSVAFLTDLAGRLDFCTTRSHMAATYLPRGASPAVRVVPDPTFALHAVDSVAPSGRRRRLGVALGGGATSAPLLRALTGPGLDVRFPWNADTCLSRSKVEEELSRREAPHVATRRLLALCAALTTLSTSEVEMVAVDNMYGDADLADLAAALVDGATVRQVEASAFGVDEALVKYDAVVVSRFHSAVAALRGATPFVAIEPSAADDGPTKLETLMRSVGLEEFYWAFDDASEPDVADLAATIEKALAGACADRARAAYAELHLEAVAAFDRLAQWVATGAGQGPAEPDLDRAASSGGPITAPMK